MEESVRKTIAIACMLFTSLPAFAQTTERRVLSKGTIITGAVVSLTGVALAAPTGEDYRILGTRYCVTDYAVDYGTCSDKISPRQRQIGWSMVAAGGAMMLIGSIRVNKKVTVHPSITGVGATVRW
jgi:hypothetical protein